jgi:hypothetical protein
MVAGCPPETGQSSGCGLRLGGKHHRPRNPDPAPSIERKTVYGAATGDARIKRESATLLKMDEGRKRVLAIVAGIIVARDLDTADDLFGGPQGSPRTDKMVAAAIQWAERIMKKIDNVYVSYLVFYSGL